MGAEIGAEVWLDSVPLKYAGPFVLRDLDLGSARTHGAGRAAGEVGRVFRAVRIRKMSKPRLLASSSPQAAWRCDTKTAKWPTWHGIPARRAPAVVRRRSYRRLQIRQPSLLSDRATITPQTYCKSWARWNVASKEWIIRQYDHEVQGGSVVKPLVGASNDGPSDAAVVRPVLASRRGLVLACGMNPRLADFDTYHMAASSHRRSGATVWPSVPTRRKSRSSIISAGVIASGPRHWDRLYEPLWHVTTWRSRWARRSSVAKTA